MIRRNPGPVASAEHPTGEAHDVTFDEPTMTDLMEESQDLHGTAMRLTREATDRIVEIGRERRARRDIETADPDRRTFLRRSLLAAGVVGGGPLGASMFSRITTPGYAASPPPVLIRHTPASPETPPAPLATTP